MTEPTFRSCTIVGCQRKLLCKGLCNTHYIRLRKYGDLDHCEHAFTVPDKLNKFSERTSSGCLVWTGNINSGGYGLIKVNNKTASAHRVIWEYYRGVVPKGLVVDHICRVRHCVDVEHMQVVTYEQNMENLGAAHADSKSGIRGVWKSPTGKKWVARVQGTRAKYLGTFATKEAASEAVLAYRNSVYTNNLVDRKLV